MPNCTADQIVLYDEHGMPVRGNPFVSHACTCVSGQGPPRLQQFAAVELMPAWWWGCVRFPSWQSFGSQSTRHTECAAEKAAASSHGRILSTVYLWPGS